jgi:hypothetical protein
MKDILEVLIPRLSEKDVLPLEVPMLIRDVLNIMNETGSISKIYSDAFIAVITI